MVRVPQRWQPEQSEGGFRVRGAGVTGAVALATPDAEAISTPDANGGTGAWALPPIPHMEPVFGKKVVR